MKHYCIVFILTALFKPCLGMEGPIIPEVLKPGSVQNLLVILTLHNHGKSKFISIVDEHEHGENILCDIDLKFINGKDKDTFEIEREIERYEERFYIKPPSSSILRAPNKIWIYCMSESNASNFSFNPEGRFMLNGNILIRKCQRKKLNFESFAGEKITIIKQNFPKNTYKAVFKDWDDLNYLLYIDGRNNTITDRYPV